MVMDGETDLVTDKYTDFLKSGLTLKEYQALTDTDSGQETKPQEQAAEHMIAEIESVRLRNSDGEEISEIQQGQDVTVEVIYQVYEEQVDEPVLGVAIRSIDHEYICGLNTLLDGMEISWKKGRNTACLIYDGFNLTGGNYYFDTALFDRTATVNFDYKSQIKKFFVRMDYIAEGVVVLNHHWCP